MHSFICSTILVLLCLSLVYNETVQNVCSPQHRHATRIAQGLVSVKATGEYHVDARTKQAAKFPIISAIGV